MELCGALKNVVALAAGICDGLDSGSNTKAAFIRIGLEEMRKFITHFHPNVNQQVWFESCGIADLITTCISGRNRKIAEHFARTKKSIQELESELLKGQKLQGTLTLKEVKQVIGRKKIESEFPLFSLLYSIFFQGAPCEKLFTL